MANIIRIEELVYSRLSHISKADWVDMLSAQGVHIDYTTFKDEYLLLEHSDYRFENGKMISSERMVYNIDYLTYDQQRNAEGIEDTIIVPMAIYDCHTDRYTILYVHYPQSDAYAAPDLSHIFSETDAPEIIQASPIRDIEPIEKSILDILSLNSLTNMNKLEKLYESIRTLEELSIPLNPETLKAVDELEEKIIKAEILPTLSEQVTPLLKPIQRDLVLVLEYHPGEEISVALSRKVKVAEILGAKTIEKEDDDLPEFLYSLDINATLLNIGVFNVHKKAVDRFKTIFPALTNPGGKAEIAIRMNSKTYNAAYIDNVNYSAGRRKTDTLQFHLQKPLKQEIPNLCKGCSIIDVYVLKDKTIVLEAK